MEFQNWQNSQSGIQFLQELDLMKVSKTKQSGELSAQDLNGIYRKIGLYYFSYLFSSIKNQNEGGMKQLAEIIQSRHDLSQNYYSRNNLNDLPTQIREKYEKNQIHKFLFDFLKESQTLLEKSEGKQVEVDFEQKVNEDEYLGLALELYAKSEILQNEPKIRQKVKQLTQSNKESEGKIVAAKNNKDDEQKQKQTEEKEFNFDDFMQEQIGFGKAQLYAMMGCSLTVMADGGQMMVIGFVLPILQKQMGWEDGLLKLLATSVFLGFGLGAITSGIWADMKGRQNAYLISTFFQSLAAFLSAFPVNYAYFMLTRSTFGFFCGVTFALNSTYTSEILPKQNRGQYYCLMTVTFTIGEIITLLIASVCLQTLDKGNWQALLFWSAVPTLLSFISCYYNMYESPRFLLITKPERRQEALGILTQMINLNNQDEIKQLGQKKSKEQFKLDEKAIMKWAEFQRQKQRVESNDITTLFSPEIQPITLKLMAVFFSLSFVFYGINFILPTILLHFGQEQEHQSSSFNFWGIFSTVLAELPSSILVAFIIEFQSLGRQNTIFYSYGICAVACLICSFSTSANFMFFSMVSIAKFFINLAFIVAFPLTSQIYSTALRATGLGFQSAICRVGGMLMPTLVYSCLSFSPTGPFVAFFVASVLSTLSAYQLPKDTTRTDLDSYFELPSTIKQKSLKNSSQK